VAFYVPCKVILDGACNPTYVNQIFINHSIEENGRR